MTDKEIVDDLFRRRVPWEQFTPEQQKMFIELVGKTCEKYNIDYSYDGEKITIKKPDKRAIYDKEEFK